MKDLLLIFLISILYSNAINAQQNLIADPSFEDYHLVYYPSPILFCPTVDSFPASTKWYDPNGASSDYETYVMTLLCPSHPTPGVPQNNFGWQWPKEGNAYWHFGSSYLETPVDTHTQREYVQTKLLVSLIAGHQYCVSFYVSLSDSCWYATDEIGAFFDDTATSFTWSWWSIGNINPGMLPDCNVWPVIPQVISNTYIIDRENWTLVSGSFVAEGGEKYITIGNFTPDSVFLDHRLYVSGGSNYVGWEASVNYYVDVVSVYDCTGHYYVADAGWDVHVCQGEEVQIGTDDYSNYEYSWSPTSGLSNPNSGMPFASPDTTTTYYLSVVDNFVQQSTDSVTVFVEECEESLILFVPNIFSPNGDGNNDVLYAYSTLIRELDFSIYNRWGEEVFHSNSLQKGWDGKNAETGVYVWQVKATLITEEQIERSGNVSLVR
jgi:gliding motility-associated-like protein